MQSLLDLWYAQQDFIESGGSVIPAILIVTFVMWILIVERYLYLMTGHKQAVARAVQEWHERRDRSSWYAHKIRSATVSRIYLKLNGTIPIIKSLVALCPLMGLLGTVTGMVEVFDIMALEGSGNPRAMASGVSHATIPTMCGMVAALSGLMFSVRLERLAQAEKDGVADQLSPMD